MSEERTYSQEELNRAVQDALHEERRQIRQWRADAERLAQLEAEAGSGKARAVTSPEASVAADTPSLDLAQLIRDTAGHEGARDPSIVAGLIEAERVTYDEDGQPTNLPELVAAALDARPYLRSTARVATVDQGARAGRTSSQDDALRLLKTAPAEFDRMVSRGLIPRDVFGGDR